MIVIKGTILKGIGGFYYVDTEKGVVECRARGRIRREGITPAVGDEVNITIVNENPLEGALEEVLPRKNSLIRPPVANIDVIVVVIAVASPSPDFFMVDKLIATAENSGIEVIIAVNKTDLDSSDEIEEIYKKAGYTVIPLCAKNGEGIDALKLLIKNKTTAFAGNSGVGKSSILNYFGYNLQTGDVSKIERGRHTTRHVELFKNKDGGFVMDTPGFSLLEIKDISPDELSDLFLEFGDYKTQCRFSECNHFNTSYSDCGVVKAVKDGKISKSRYDNYCQIYDKIKDIKDWEKKNNGN